MQMNDLSSDMIDQRDQAINDIRMLGRMGQNICPVCAHYNHGEGCKDECPKCLKEDHFVWRGVQDV